MTRKLMILIAVLSIIVVALFVNERINEYSYQGNLDLATEYPPPGESAAIESIISSLKTILKEEYPAPKRMMRDAHPKQHGLVKAEFAIADDINIDLKKGIFSQSNTYNAWIRYSNLSAGAADISKDSRGMAIKLMGVEGEKLLPGQTNATTHDFVFMSTQYFVTKDVKGFADLLSAINDEHLIGHMLTHPRLLMLFSKVRIQIPSLFAASWGSTTPYKLGDKAVKYAVMPSIPPNEAMPQDPSHDYLRERMAATLKERDVLLDFFVQVQVDAEKMPIEDPRVVWDQELSPFVKVATIKVLKQEFDTSEQHLYGDQLSFTPWHALPDHRPLGGINRGRKIIYETMSEFRHTNNNEVSAEPIDWITF